MFTLSDSIEEYIKNLLSLSSRKWVDIQRGELAVKFDCVPSQINYVLATRFTPERGYLVESKRGGHGYIRINRIKPFSQTWENILKEEGLDLRRARDLLQGLLDERIVSHREASIIESGLKEEVFKGLSLGEKEKNIFIKRFFYNMIITVLRDNG